MSQVVERNWKNWNELRKDFLSRVKSTFMLMRIHEFKKAEIFREIVFNVDCPSVSKVAIDKLQNIAKEFGLTLVNVYIANFRTKGDSLNFKFKVNRGK